MFQTNNPSILVTFNQIYSHIYNLHIKFELTKKNHFKIMINSNHVTYHNEHNQTSYPFYYYKMCAIENNIVENENNKIKNIINSDAMLRYQIMANPSNFKRSTHIIYIMCN